MVIKDPTWTMRYVARARRQRRKYMKQARELKAAGREAYGRVYDTLLRSYVRSARSETRTIVVMGPQARREAKIERAARKELAQLRVQWAAERAAQQAAQQAVQS